MSFNQIKSDKSDTQYRKTGRSGSFNQQRNSSSTYVKGGGGGGAGLTPSPSITSASSVSSNRSFKKSYNAHGGQSRVNPSTTSSDESNSASTARTVENGTHVQSQLHGASDAPVTNAITKSTESSAAQRSTGTVPNAPISQSSPVISDPAPPTTPAKAPGDASKGFLFQFGTISPGFMNGMAIPARTSSAPPNLDEQKRDQALHGHNSPRPVTSMPAPPVPKQQPPRKDAGLANQSNALEAQSGSKAKMDPQVSTLPLSSQMQKPSVVPLTGVSMAMPYHQSHTQASIQFCGPNPQIKSQGKSTASLQMPIPMHLPIGNPAQMQQHVFVPGLQPHSMHPQGIMQGPNMSFSPQMGAQLPHQLGNMGISISPQYAQQQGVKFAGPRKTTPVKITHPETHEELRLDKRVDVYSDGGSSGARSHPNLPSQPQPVQSFAASHSVNYYPSSSYNTSSLFFPSPNSLTLTSNQITSNSQPQRCNYPVNHSPQNVGFMNQSSLSSLPVNKTCVPTPGIVEPPNLERFCDVHNVISSTQLGVTSVAIKSSGGSGVVDLSLSNSSIFGVENSESPCASGVSGGATSSVLQKGSESCSEISSQQSKLSSDSSASRSLLKQSIAVSAENHTKSHLMHSSAAVGEDSGSVVSNNEVRRKESLSRSNSLKDSQKKSGKEGQSQNQVAVQSPSVASVPSRADDSGISDSVVSENLETKTNYSAALSSGYAPATPDTWSVTSNVDSNAFEVKTNCYAKGPACISAEGSGVQAVDSLNNHNHDQLEESSQRDKTIKEYILETDYVNERSHEGSKQNSNDSGSSVESVALKSPEFNQTEQDAAEASTEVLSWKMVQQGQDESMSCSAESDRTGGNLGMSTATTLDFRDISLNRYTHIVSNETVSLNCDTSDQQSVDPPEATSQHSKDNAENVGSASVSHLVLVSKDKPILEPSKVKTTSKGKKKIREILQKADAAGPTSDLYNAYKKPEEKKEAAVSSEITESASTSGSLNLLPADATASGKDGQSKAEPDDWEDAADMSTPKLEVSDKSQLTSDGSGSMAKKYSRDFLLKFAEQYIDLPAGFKITGDIAEALKSADISSHVERDLQLHPSFGRNIDRLGGMSRLDRCGSGVFEEDRWPKVPGPFGSGRDVRLDASFGSNAGFRPSQGSNFGALRNPRSQTPLQYAGGILSGPVQSMGNQGGMQRNGPDGERWQRSSSFQQRGLIPSPSPQIPLQMMHKAEKKYEVGKVTDEEEAKQRQLKAILNKLTPQNFEKLFEQVKAVNIDNAATLSGVISQIFEKALMEPTFCEMYANFCLHLAAELPDFSEDNEKITFKRLLLNKCQEEFERGEREQEEANKADEGEVKQSDEEREEKRIKARRRMLGNIRLIGELYNKKMLTERIMHECIKKLLGQYQDPDEEDVEALCKLMSTIGEMIDHHKAKEHMDAYFERMKLLSINMNLSSRMRFMLRDAIDLRKNKWQLKRKIEGPKKIEEVHRDAAQERQAQTSRLGRGPGNNSSARRNPMDFGPRGLSMLSSPNVQVGGLRGLPTQSRGYGSQDVRREDRQSYEARTVPLPQRPLDDDSITLGPEGGLTRGMSVRVPAAISNSSVSDVPPVAGDSKKMITGFNGYGNLSEYAPYSSREEPRYIPDRFAGPTAYDQSSAQGGNMNHGNRDLRNADQSFDQRVAASPPAQMQGPTISQNASSEKAWPEERLQDMSMSAIKEYYSARDEKEVALCVKDLNSPSFHPTMVSLWVTDSFERKDMERDLLAKLLVNLAKSQDGTLSQSQLMKGFEAVLSTLEDAVNDAPRASEFLGCIFAKVITENIISLKEIGRLIYEGGEEPGRLLKVGLAADVLGSTLEVIKLDKGDTVLSEIRTSSTLRLETFRPPNPIISKKLEKFIEDGDARHILLS